MYTYTQANRLTAVSGTGLSWSAAYNSDGARLRQVANSTPTTYTQDLAAPLPVVLQAKTSNTTTLYLFDIGARPLAEYDSAWEYLLPDGLGSVRQLVDAGGNVKLTEAYEPYGSVLTSQGSATSAFGFTGEQFESYTQLIFLRARYMQTGLGMFLSRDPWEGDVFYPLTYNGWAYVEGNPVNNSDPTGTCKKDQPGDPDGTCRVEPKEYLYKIARANSVYPLENIKAWNPEYAPTYDVWAGNLVYLRARNATPSVQGESPLDTISGYLEGRMNSSTVGCLTWLVKGNEIVYDFAKIPPERANFTYSGFGISISTLPSGGDATITDYAGFIWGFDPSSPSVIRDYEGPTISGSAGMTVILPPGLASLGGGVGGFKSLTSQVFGFVGYTSAGINAGTPGVGLTFSFLGMYYIGDESSLWPYGDSEHPARGMYSAISTGEGSPLKGTPPGDNSFIAATRSSTADQAYRVLGWYYATKGLTPLR